MKEAEVNAQVREGLGTREAKRLRRQGFVPAVIYGKGMEPVHVALKVRDAERLLAEGARLVKVRVDGQEYDTVLQDVQYDHLNERILHLDFHKVELTERVRMTVLVELKGEPKPGGVLEKHLDEVEIEAVAAKAPDKIVVDVSGLDFGDVVHIKDLQVPEGVKLLEEPDEVVVSLMAPTAEEEEAEEAEEEEREPELVQKRKKKEEEEQPE